MIGFTPHSAKQELALFSKKKKILLATGIQFGKTTVGAVFIRRLMHEFNAPDDNFIVTAPNYKILKQSSLPAFLKTMGGLGRYSGQDAAYYIKNGPTVYMRTSTDPDSIVGITNVRGIWGDEAGKYPLYFWENMQARSAFKDCPIILTTSPYSLNWIYKEMIRPYLRGVIDPDVEIIMAASVENPYFSKTVYEKQKRTMDPRRFSMIYGGEWSRFEGLVYNCFDTDLNVCKQFDHGPQRFYVGGVDWGFTDPFCIKIRSVSPSGKMVDVSEFYKPGLRSSEQIEAILLKNRIYRPRSFQCDPSRPDMIDELVSLGVPAEPAHNDILEGIDAHYEYVNSRDYQIMEGTCPHTLDEIEMYHYAEPKNLGVDQGKDKKADLPVDNYNHCFAGETRIITREGMKAIKDIKRGDLVLTRKGWKRVLLRWDNGVQEVVEICVQGVSIKCTRSHKFFTQNEGFKRLDALRYIDEVIILKKWKKILLFLMASNTLGIRKERDPSDSTIVQAPKNPTEDFIGPYGFITLEKFPKGMTFITKTATHSTIKLKTLSAWMKSLITRNMPGNLKKRVNSFKKCKRIWTELDPLQVNGIDLKKENDGIKNMGENSGGPRPGKRKKVTANFARKYILPTHFHWPRISLNSVLMPVKVLIEETLGSIMSKGHVITAGKVIRPIDIAIEGFAPPIVQRKTLEHVYDLMVEDQHEYFAENILVSNCMDVDRYISLKLKKDGFDFKFDPKSPEEEEKRILTPSERLEKLKRLNQESA